MSMTIMQRLKAETSAAHERIEEAFDLAARTRCLESYRALLARLYGFHATWEPRAEAVMSDKAFFRERRKAGLLIRDLRALGMSEAAIAALPLCDALMPLDNEAQALGAMYVIEGSTLGGTIIARHIARNLGLSPGSGCSFFRCYGDETGPMWKRFGTRLEALSAPDDASTIVASANRTFALLQDWLFTTAPGPALELSEPLAS